MTALLGESARDAAAEALAVCEHGADEFGLGWYRSAAEHGFLTGRADAVLAVLEPFVAALIKAARDDERVAERGRLSALLVKHQDTIAGFAGDKARAVGLIAQLLKLGQPPPNTSATTSQPTDRTSP